jgi:hypothetical protein
LPSLKCNFDVFEHKCTTAIIAEKEFFCHGFDNLLFSSVVSLSSASKKDPGNEAKPWHNFFGLERMLKTAFL